MAQNNQALQNKLSELKATAEAYENSTNAAENKTDQEANNLKADALRLLVEMNQALGNYHLDRHIDRSHDFKKSAENKVTLEHGVASEHKVTLENKLASETAGMKPDAAKNQSSNSTITMIRKLSPELQDYLSSPNFWGILFTPDHSINAVINNHTPIMLVLRNSFAVHETIEFLEELLNCPDINILFEDDHQFKHSALNTILYTGSCFIPGHERHDRYFQMLQTLLTRFPESIQHIYFEIPYEGHEDGKSYLYNCATEGHLHQIKFLHQHGANLDFIEKFGTTALFTAVQNGHFELVRFLIIEAKVKLDCKFMPYDETVFHLMAYKVAVPRKNALLGVAMLLCAGAKYNVLNRGKKTPYEVTQMDPNDFPLHVRRDPANEPGEDFEPNMIKPDYMRGVLAEMLKCIDDFFEAIKAKNVKQIKEYLEAGLPIHCRNAEGETPLHVASRLNSPEILKLLFRHSTQLIAEDDNNNTPIDIAANNAPKNLPTLMNVVQEVVDNRVLLVKESMLVSYSNYKQSFPTFLMVKIWEYYEETPNVASTTEGKKCILHAIDKSLASQHIHAAATRIQRANKPKP